MNSFLKNDNRLESMIQELIDFRTYKKSYFSSMKKFISHSFRLGNNYEENKEIDSFISSLDAASGNFEASEIPETLKKESVMTERLINFYITYLAGTRV